MTAGRTQFDVVIIGAGPAGLSLTRMLAECDLSVALIERQPQATLAEPSFDGREIALTHRSIELLRKLGAWARIPDADISPLGEARVVDARGAHAIRFRPPASAEDGLGAFVPNHQIRRALFETVAQQANVTLLPETVATSVDTSRHMATLALADGTRLGARLVVAADTRFSEMRRRMGIRAAMRDFGRTMMVCRVAHDLPHEQVATEWFRYGQTIATLPLKGTDETPNISSLVLTLPARQIERLMSAGEAAFNAEVTERYERRLGEMRLVSTRHAYPLVAVYADRFVAERFALVGDAAVGMHPVTAHGFNFGILSAHTLGGLVARAAATGNDIGSAALLARYQGAHRLATRPLYLATNSTVLLYTDDRVPARLLRDAVIRAGESLAPFRHAVARRLTRGIGDRQFPTPPRPLRGPRLAAPRSAP